MQRYFSYSPQSSFEFFATAAEAKHEAECATAKARSWANDAGEWEDDVTEICYGQILGAVVRVKDPSDESAEYELQETF